MNRYIVTLILALSLIIPTGNAFGKDWQIDIDHSAAHFSIQHMNIAMVRGHLANLAGTGTFDDKTGKLIGLKIRVGVGSIDTGVIKRDDHLRSADFFEVAKYPAITFVSKQIGGGKVIGDLTIKDVTREVTLKIDGPTEVMTDPWGNLRKGAKLALKLDRTDYGITYGSALPGGGLTIGHEVDVEADIEFLILNPKLAK